MRQLYVIDYSNAHWCGGGLYCVAWANSPDEATQAAEAWMEETQRELFDDHYIDDEAYEDESAYVVDSVMLLEESDHREFYEDEDQRRHFYPCVNE